MALSESTSADVLVVESNRSLIEALLSLLAEEGYGARGVSSLEEALAEIERQSYALILADLFAGISKHSFTPAHILRRRAQRIPLGLITTQAHVLEQPHLDGFAFALPKPVAAPVLFTEIALCLKRPLSPQEQRQARIVEQFLAAWGFQEWKSLLSLCTNEIICSPSFPFPSTSGRPVQGKMALLALLTSIRRRYHSFRIEVQGIYHRPHGLAVPYIGYVAEFGKGWESFSGTDLFEFTGEQICQIGNEPRSSSSARPDIAL